MLNPSEDDLWNLLREASGMPYGAAQIALIEQVLARADSIGSDDLAFTARMLATTAYTHGGEPAKSFVTFSWCLAEYDRDPVRYQRHTHNLLWHFKYMISALRRFPEIPLSRTYAALDDMERRYRSGGHSMHAVYAYRQSIAAHVGDVDEAEKWFQKWNTAARDGLSDCAGCDPTSKAHWLASQHRDEEAIAVAEPVLGGKLTCVEQPQSILTTLLLPYARTGRDDSARDAHRRAYRVMRSNLADFGQISVHLTFLALTGNENLAREILIRHLPWLDVAPSPADEMDFAAAGALVLRRLREAGHGATTVHRPAHGSRAAADLSVADLEATLVATATDLASRFDARNGTGEQSRQVRDTIEAEPRNAQIPIATATARRVRPAGPTPIKTIEPPAIPAAASVDELLDLAEDHWHCDRVADALAVATEFDERHALTELDPLQRARRADLNGLVCANSNDLEMAEISWGSAIDRYAEAGDELRRQMARCRVAVLMCRTDRADVGLPIAEDATSYLAVHAPKDRLTAVHRRMALAYMFAGRADDALQSLDEAERYIDHDNFAQARPKLATERAGMLAEFGRLPEAGTAAEAAREVCRERGYQEGVATCCWIIGRIAELNADLPKAIACYEEGLATADDESLRRSLRRQRAVMLSRTSRAAESIDDLIDEVASAGDDDVDSALIARHALAVAYVNSDQPLDAAEVAEETLGTLPDGDPRSELVRHVLAQALRALGQPDAALEQLGVIADSGRRRGSDELVAEMHEQMGDLLDSLDRDAEAAARYATAAASYDTAGQQLASARARRRTAMSLMWAERVDEAIQALADADMATLTLTTSPDHDGGTGTEGEAAVAWERAMLACEGARILARSGDLDAALLRAASAPDQLNRLGDANAARFAASVLAHLLDRAERDQEAAALRKLYGIPQ